MSDRAEMIRPERPRLTEPQRQLLAEIEEAGVLYIRRYGPYGRTAEALVRKGAAFVSEPDFSANGQDGYSVRLGPDRDDR